MPFQLTDRERRWLDALLILATVAVGVHRGRLRLGSSSSTSATSSSSSSWPGCSRSSSARSSRASCGSCRALPRVAAVVVVYAMLLGGDQSSSSVVVAQARSPTSISDFIAGVPELQRDLPTILAPWQERLQAIGLGQVDLAAQANDLPGQPQRLRGPARRAAPAARRRQPRARSATCCSCSSCRCTWSSTASGSCRSCFRLVPPAYAEEARLLETSVAHSFGGFLRGQAVLGRRLRRDRGTHERRLRPRLPAGHRGGGRRPHGHPVLRAVRGLAAAGPRRDRRPARRASCPTIVVMGVGWFIVMNIVQPRLMEQASASTRSSSSGRCSSARRSRASSAPSSASRSPRSSRPSSSTTSAARPARTPAAACDGRAAAAPASRLREGRHDPGRPGEPIARRGRRRGRSEVVPT